MSTWKVVTIGTDDDISQLVVKHLPPSDIEQLDRMVEEDGDSAYYYVTRVKCADVFAHAKLIAKNLSRSSSADGQRTIVMMQFHNLHRTTLYNLLFHPGAEEVHMLGICDKYNMNYEYERQELPRDWTYVEDSDGDDGDNDNYEEDTDPIPPAEDE